MTKTKKNIDYETRSYIYSHKIWRETRGGLREESHKIAVSTRWGFCCSKPRASKFVEIREKAVAMLKPQGL
jgi:hypothetical protein